MVSLFTASLHPNISPGSHPGIPGCPAAMRAIVALSLTLWFLFEEEWECADWGTPESMREAMHASQWMFASELSFVPIWLRPLMDQTKRSNQPEGLPTEEAKILWCCDVFQFAILVPVPV